MSPSSFRDLRVWQEAMELTIEVYRNTATFPKHELYGLTQQMRRVHARGSLLELQTQLSIAQQLQYLREPDGKRLTAMAEGVGRALSGLIASIHVPENS